MCIDPGEKLLDVCRACHGNMLRYSFECSSFEEFEDNPASFDLVYAATCFHWLKPEARFRKAAWLLRENGGLAVFTNQHTKKKEGFFSEVQSVYRIIAPELVPSTPSIPIDEDPVEENPLGLLHQSAFDREIEYTSEDYIGLLGTFSDHIALGERRLKELCNEVHMLIEKRYGGNISKTLTTTHAIYRNAQG